MTPTETLKHEHQIILLVLDAVEREAQLMEKEGQLRAQRVEQMVDFFRNFADGCHHAKEEKLLFVKMHERGMPLQGGPLAAMLYEHDEGRKRVSAVADALPPASDGDPAALAAVRDNLVGYVQLLRAHIAKENGVLFPMADQLLTPQDQQELTAAFDRVEAEEIGEGVHEKYHELAHQLAH
jgi:hemerythrin-like domain-containing protein